MDAVDIIARKRDGRELSHLDIDYFLRGYMDRQVNEIQVAALLMALYFKGMNIPELVAFTETLVNSGQPLQWDNPGEPVVNTCSIGGRGDKTTLILAPLLAAAGLFLPVIAERVRDPAGGSVEKLEGIPGFRASLEPEAFMKLVRQNGVAVIDHHTKIIPLEGELSRIGQATATVQNIHLLASSNIGRQVASGARNIALEVKVGAGSHLKNLRQAVDLAHTLVALGQNFNRRTFVLLTDLSQPLGRAVGVLPELHEAVETLKGGGPPDLVEVVLQLGGWLLAAVGKAANPEEGRRLLNELRTNGAGWERFQIMIRDQGGDPAGLERLPGAPLIVSWKAKRKGYIHFLQMDRINRAVKLMSAAAGDRSSGSVPPAGLVLEKKAGDHTAVGERLGTLHLQDDTRLDLILSELQDAVVISKSQVSPPVLVYRAIE